MDCLNAAHQAADGLQVVKLLLRNARLPIVFSTEGNFRDCVEAWNDRGRVGAGVKEQPHDPGGATANDDKQGYAA